MNAKILFCICIALAACNTNPPKHITNLSAYDQKDSLALAALFKIAMQMPSSSDSALMAAEKIGGKNAALLDMYTYGSARHSIQTGKLEKAKLVSQNGLIALGKDSVTILAGKYYNLLGSVHAIQNEQEEAARYYAKAIEIFEDAKELKQVAAIQFNLANLFLGRLEYQKAYEYSLSAESKWKALQDTVYLPICQGLLAVTSAKIGKQEEAMAYASAGLANSRKYQNNLGIVFAQYASADLELQSGNYRNALSILDTASLLAHKLNSFQLILAIKAAQVTGHLQLEQYPQAIKHGEEALQIAQSMGNEEIQYNLYKNLAKSYSGTGRFQKAFNFMEKADQLYSQKSNSKNQVIIQELLVKYETEKKSNQILLQQKELTRQREWIFGLAAFLILAVIGLIGYRNYNVQRNKIKSIEQERDLQLALTSGEEKERTRLAGELHDGIASNLVALTLKLEASQNYFYPNFEQMAILLRQTHKEVRFVAHNLSPIDFSQISVQKAIQEFCRLISSEQLPVNYYANFSENLLSVSSSLILYRTVQECIQNALKHAQASQIHVQCMEDKLRHQLTFSVEDNGVGFDLTEINDTGFSFLRKRISQIAATMNIESQKGRGTAVYIYLNYTPGISFHSI